MTDCAWRRSASVQDATLTERAFYNLKPEKEVIVKRITALIVLAALFFFLGVLIGYATAGIDPGLWIPLKGPLYIDTGSIAYPSINIVSLWVKIVPEKDSEAFTRVREFLRKRGKDHRAYEYTGFLSEIDCMSKSHRKLSIIHYNKDKNIIYSANDANALWEPIERENGFQLLHTVFCPGREKRILAGHQKD